MKKYIILCITILLSLPLYAQTKEQAFRQAVARSRVAEDYSSMAVIERGDLSETEVKNWFRQNVNLSSVYRELEVNYFGKVWKWGAERPTQITVGYLSQDNQGLFLEYWEARYKAAEEAKRRSFVQNFIVGVVGFGLAVEFFSSDSGKKTLLAFASALAGGDSSSRSRAQIASKKDEEDYFDPNNCEVPDYKTNEGKFQKESVFSPEKFTYFIEYSDGSFATIIYYPGYNDYKYGFHCPHEPSDIDGYRTMEDAARAAWVYHKYGEIRTMGKKNGSNPNRTSAENDEKTNHHSSSSIDPNNCAIEGYKISSQEDEKNKSRIVYVLRFYDGKYTTVYCYYKRDYYKYAFSRSFDVDVSGYQSLDDAAKASWVYKKYGKIRTRGKK